MALASPAPMSTTVKLSGLLRTRVHGGGLLWVVRRLADRFPVLAPARDRLEGYLDRHSERVAAEFDARHGTDTFERAHLHAFEVGQSLEAHFAGWKYGPVNPDFFQEIIERLRLPPERYGFLDVGAGKGIGMMLASHGPFRRLIAVEFARELVDIGKRNVQRYSAVTGRPVAVEWVCEDFMAYELPDEPLVLFLNNPFPTDISLRAVAHIEKWLAGKGRDAIVVYRKMAPEVARALESSKHLSLVEWSPYWAAYRARPARAQA